MQTHGVGPDTPFAIWNTSIARFNRAQATHHGNESRLSPSSVRNEERPAPKRDRAFRKIVGTDLLSHSYAAVPSALEGLTSEFGMGSGGPPPPLVPTNLVLNWGVYTNEYLYSTCFLWENKPRMKSWRRVVKPHGRLVQVCFNHYWPSTPCLSTSSSSSGL